jgi:hypothetical protein
MSLRKLDNWCCCSSTWTVLEFDPGISEFGPEIFKCWNTENNALVYSLFSRILKSWVPVFKVLFFNLIFLFFAVTFGTQCT